MGRRGEEPRVGLMAVLGPSPAVEQRFRGAARTLPGGPLSGSGLAAHQWQMGPRLSVSRSLEANQAAVAVRLPLDLSNSQPQVCRPLAGQSAGAEGAEHSLLGHCLVSRS